MPGQCSRTTERLHDGEGDLRVNNPDVPGVRFAPGSPRQRYPYVDPTKERRDGPEQT